MLISNILLDQFQNIFQQLIHMIARNHSDVISNQEKQRVNEVIILKTSNKNISREVPCCQRDIIWSLGPPKWQIRA